MKDNFEYSVQRGFLCSADVLALATSFHAAFDDNNDHYRPLANVVQFNFSEVAGSEILGPVSKKIQSHFTERLGVSDIRLAKCWLVKSQARDTDAAKLPYLAHFDKHRCLKAMIYLHNVTEDHGAIRFGKLLSPSEIDIRRKRLPANYKELGLNTIKVSELKSDMEPIVGSDGDVIFFDTNAAHCAGIVSEGFERHVIRFDFDVPGFNPRKSLVKRLISFISSRIR